MKYFMITLLITLSFSLQATEMGKIPPEEAKCMVAALKEALKETSYYEYDFQVETLETNLKTKISSFLSSAKVYEVGIYDSTQDLIYSSLFIPEITKKYNDRGEISSLSCYVGRGNIHAPNGDLIYDVFRERTEKNLSKGN